MTTDISNAGAGGRTTEINLPSAIAAVREALGTELDDVDAKLRQGGEEGLTDMVRRTNGRSGIHSVHCGQCL